jgi:transposase
MSKYTTKSLAQLPPGMLFAGIDLSLDTLAVVVLDEKGNRRDRFPVPNNPTGYAVLRERLHRTVAKHHAPSVWVGMEPTNYYWKPVGYDLEQHQVEFRLVNALTVKRHREGDHLDRRKDDWRDAFTIADLLRTGKFTETRLPHGVYADLQTGYGAYQRLRRDRGRQLTLRVNTVRQLFPDFQQVFKDLSGATASAIIEAGVWPQRIAQRSEAEFLAQVREHFTGQRLNVQQALRLQALAAQAVGGREATGALQLIAQHQVETIRQLDHQAAQLLGTLLELFHTLPEAPYLLSIQGLTAPSALGLLAYTGNLQQYRAGSALVKLAGTQPTPNTSGRKSYSPTPFSHQGRAGLRTVLYFTTLRLIRENEALQHHYARLTTRSVHPLPKMQAIGACMNKLLWYAWHVVKRRDYYAPDHWRHPSSA